MKCGKGRLKTIRPVSFFRQPQTRNQPIKSYTLNIPHFEYPESFQKIVELNLVDFDIWHLLDSDWAAELYQGLQTRYPNRKLIPFAKRSDCDDTACFEIGKGGKVQLIHDFASPGWEQR